MLDTGQENIRNWALHYVDKHYTYEYSAKVLLMWL